MTKKQFIAVFALIAAVSLFWIVQKSMEFSYRMEARQYCAREAFSRMSDVFGFEMIQGEVYDYSRVDPERVVESKAAYDLFFGFCMDSYYHSFW